MSPEQRKELREKFKQKRQDRMEHKGN
jgi:Spy/CpxP family protein refolding chaperone